VVQIFQSKGAASKDKVGGAGIGLVVPGAYKQQQQEGIKKPINYNRLSQQYSNNTNSNK
jgi:hypothetical protein